MKPACSFSTNRRVLLAPALLVLLGAAGCDDAAETRDPRAITALTAELAPVVEGHNEFSLALYQDAARAEGNVFFSPFSITAAFGMTYAGARGETAEEMRNVLRIGAEGESYHQQLGALMADLGGAHGRGYTLLVANRLFGQAGFPFEQPFVDLTASAYGAPLAEVDYGQAEAARSHINDWVSDQTQAEIPELLDSDAVDGDTRLVLANAIYFAASWEKGFNPVDTRTRAFTRADGVTVDAPMMSQEANFRGVFREDLSAVELDYRDDEVSMVLIIPREHDGLPAIEAVLDPAWLADLLADMNESNSVVELPRFEVEETLPLAQLIQEMGMAKAFDPSQADFSGMLDPAVDRLHISSAVHRAVVHVDEVGTIAAAATAVGVSVISMPSAFTADRPFVYLIRDKLTSTILFAGRVSDPTPATAG